MGLLDSVERGLERAVNGAFARTFRSGVQPVEIASALKRELDIGSVIVDRDRVLAPNRFVVRVSQKDADRLHAMGSTLQQELLRLVEKHASRQGYQLLGPADVEVRADPSLTPGVLEVDSSNVEGSVSWTPVLEIDGVAHPLRKGSTIVGRGGDAGVRITDTAASRQHLEIIWDGSAGLARDLGSTNGSKINGQRFREAALTPDTVITIGQTSLRFRLQPSRNSTSQPQGSPVQPKGSAAPSQSPAAPSAPRQQGGDGAPGIDQDFWRGL